MSKRRSTVMARYCKARGAMKGWKNANGIKSSQSASPTRSKNKVQP
jgi:hypothetical protein